MKTPYALQASDPLVAQNSVPDSTPKPKRRKGRICEEIAREANMSVHKARMTMEVMKYAPELLQEIIDGKIKLRDAVKAVRVVRGIAPREHDDRTFEERVIRSFENWSHRWATDAMPQVREIIHRITEPR